MIEAAPREPGPRRDRIALAVVLVVLLAGVAGIAVVGGAAKKQLPLLPVGFAAGRTAAADAMSMRARPVEYRIAAGVSAPADKATAYEFASAEREEIDRLRNALGLTGAVKAGADGWAVTDGPRVLRVQNQPGMPWHFDLEHARCGPDMAVSSLGAVPADAVDCGAVGGSAGSGAIEPEVTLSPEPAPTSTGEPCPMPPCPEGQACIQACPKPHYAPPPRPAELPSQADAEAIGRAFFTRLGIHDATVDVNDAYSAWSVVAHPTVDGVSTTGFDQHVSVGPKGQIVTASGWLARTSPLGDYPLVDVATAVKRLESGFGGGWAPAPMARPADAPTGSGSATMIAPAPGEPGNPVADATPVVLTITSARLTLQLVPAYEPGSPSAHLIPAFLLGTDDGGTVTVVAVADEYMDATPPSAGIEPDPR